MRFFFAILLTSLISISPNYINAQHSEIGISVTLSGHFIFGPYYRYWFDDNNEIDLMIPAAWEGKGKVLFPSGVQTGYHYYFGESHWRPSVGVQYSLFFAPKINNKRNNLNIFSLVPGIQYRWNETRFNVEELIWISYFKMNGKSKIFPAGLETKFGVKL